MSRASRNLFNDAPAKPEQGLPARSELLPGSAQYPELLLELKDVPKKLYALGNIALLGQPALAIVGARKATAYGLECAERFARRAAAWGVTVVSGGAIGCDMAAHRGALDAGGNTVVVLGSGADVVYPLRARNLLREVLAQGGVLLSEAPWGSPPVAWAFSRRNRIIAALAKATLIVEAGLPSGTFQTADHTLALGNEVLVVPGPIFSATCKGANRLLSQGACPVVDDESFDDVLSRIFGPAQHFGLSTPCLPLNEAAPSEDSLSSGNRCAARGEATLAPLEIRLRQITAGIMADLSANPMTMEALAQAHTWDTMEVVRTISTLEVKGEVVRLRDGRYMTKPGKGA